MIRKLVLAGSLCLFTLSALAQADHGRVLPDGYNPASSPPFSNGVWAGGTFYVAGHLGIDPATGQAAADPEAEAHLLMEAVKGTLEKGGLHLDDLVSVTIYCTDIALYDKFNAVYRSYFHDVYPARAFIGVSKLVRGAHFEIQAVAVKAHAAPQKK